MYASDEGGGRIGKLGGGGGVGGGRLTVIRIGTYRTKPNPVVVLSKAAGPLQGLRVRIPPRAWGSVSCECCQVEVSMTSRLLVQTNPNECGVSAISKPQQ